jgi:nucleoside-diphosphate-sugar epimerase
MNKISVYGSTGFIGEAFCNLYSDEVVEIPRNSRPPITKNILYFISTTTNYNVYEDLHIDINTNLNILMDVLQYCKDEDIVFNYVSAGFVYGSDIIDAKEIDNPDPRGFYSITKRSAEQLLISFCNTFGVKYRIMRLSNLYGTDKTVSSKKNVLGYMVSLMKQNKDITLYDNGEVLRDYMHVDDVCRALRLVMSKGNINEIYNIASGNPIKFRTIIEKLKEKLDSKSNLIGIETPEFYKMVQAKNFSLNVDKLKSLGFDPKYTLDEGLDILCYNT